MARPTRAGKKATCNINIAVTEEEKAYIESVLPKGASITTFTRSVFFEAIGLNEKEVNKIEPETSVNEETKQLALV